MPERSIAATVLKFTAWFAAIGIAYGIYTFLEHPRELFSGIVLILYPALITPIGALVGLLWGLAAHYHSKPRALSETPGRFQAEADRINREIAEGARRTSRGDPGSE